MQGTDINDRSLNKGIKRYSMDSNKMRGVKGLDERITGGIYKGLEGLGTEGECGGLGSRGMRIGTCSG